MVRMTSESDPLKESRFNGRWYALLFANLLIPVLAAYIPLLIEGKSVHDLWPAWNDEWWWWQQANAVAHYGKPLGYWGYQGNHAPMGTFASWGPAAVIPFGIFGAVFGWQLYSYFYANLLFSLEAILLFVLLTEIDQKALLYLLPVNCLQLVRNAFLITSMAETSRYSIGLITVGLLIYLWHQQEGCHWILKYIVLPIWMIFAGQAYSLYTGLAWAYFLFLHRKNNWKKYLFASVETVIYMFLSQLLLTRFSCEYPYRQTGSLLFTARSNIKKLLKWLLHGHSVGFLRVFFVCYVVLIFFLLFYGIYQLKRYSRIDAVHASALVILSAFFLGFIALDDTTAWTFTRGLSVGLLVSTFLLCCSQDRKPILVFLLCTCLSLPWINQLTTEFYSEDRFKIDFSEDCGQTDEVINNTLILDKETIDPWDNTVEIYNEKNLRMTLALPAGFSANMCKRTAVGSARWAIIENEEDPDETAAITDSLKKMGYSILCQTEDITVLRK